MPTMSRQGSQCAWITPVAYHTPALCLLAISNLSNPQTSLSHAVSRKYPNSIQICSTSFLFSPWWHAGEHVWQQGTHTHTLTHRHKTYNTPSVGVGPGICHRQQTGHGVPAAGMRNIAKWPTHRIASMINVILAVLASGLCSRQAQQRWTGGTTSCPNHQAHHNANAFMNARKAWACIPPMCPNSSLACHVTYPSTCRHECRMASQSRFSQTDSASSNSLRQGRGGSRYELSYNSFSMSNQLPAWLTGSRNNKAQHGRGQQQARHGRTRQGMEATQGRQGALTCT